MDRRLALIVMVSTALAVLTVTAATATPGVSGTPLYAYRMEQASSKMNFLSTEMANFTYIAEKGYVLSYDATGFCNPEPLAPTGEEMETCWPQCTTNEITWCQYTCEDTCFMSTCQQNTCSQTCYTCPEDTCNNTCTSPYTCHLSTCVSTCNPTCTSPWTCQYSGC
jgi:hypothetical protein